MKAYWYYCCDYGHNWVVFRDEDAQEEPGDDTCPFGHEAVQLSKEPMLDMVQLSIRPAARIIQLNTGRTAHEYEYFLVVTDLHNEIERMSKRAMTWTNVKAAMDRFRTRPDKPGTVDPTKAWELMDQLDAEE